MHIKNYIGNRDFYKTVFTVAIPIMLQDLITNFVSMLDNIMVGKLGTEPMSGVSIVNQLIFVFNLAIFGAMSGIGIYTSQYYGKKDNDGIRYTLRTKLLTALVIAAVAICLLTALPEPMISLFLHTSEQGDVGNLSLTMEYGKQYLSVILLGLFPFALTQVFSSTLRETGDTVTPMAAGFCAVVVNCIFNYLLIFGKFGFPEMGVKGAAVATVMSRFTELLIVVLSVFLRRERFGYIKGFFVKFSIPAALLKSYLAKGVPLMLNEVLWSTGMTMLTIAYSLHGLYVVAAISISSTVINLFSIGFQSFGVAIGILSGRHLGAGEHENAIDVVRKLMLFTTAMGLVVGLLLFAVGGKITALYNVDEQSKTLAVYFIAVSGLIMPFHAFAHGSYFTLRSGGKTLLTFLFDCGSHWGLLVASAYLMYYAFHLPIRVVFPIAEGMVAIKAIIGYILVKSKIWVKTII